jgi:two-component system sensor histidine kinase MprB
VRVLTQGIGPRGAVQVARSLEEVDSVLSDQLLLLVLVGAGGILLAAVLSIVVARTALRPIALFTRRTESLTAHPDPSQRLEVSGRDEIARLAQSFNTTLDALEQSVEAQRNLVADASHELRTPIATLRANIQLLRDADRLSPEEQRSLRDDIITELDELTALVADVVELARGTKPTGEPDDVRLDAIVGDVVQRTRRRATDLGFDVELEPTLIEGEPERVGRAVTNLLDNARKWSPPGGNVEVRLADGVLSVRDHGAGFSQEDLPHVFDRFYRAQRARGQPGSGLGLAIVRQAAEAHGGWARASNAEGGGALLRVSFGNSTSELTPGEVGASLS